MATEAMQRLRTLVIFDMRTGNLRQVSTAVHVVCNEIVTRGALDADRFHRPRTSMDSKEFQVEVVCRQRAFYNVSAPDAESAQRAAVERWQRGEASDLAGYDWCELESTEATEAPDASRREQDDELVLRFIRERERLLLRLGGNALDASLSDAISASQAATDLGWVRPGVGGADTVRAVEALDRLCSRRRLVCFERDRVRAGERGQIHLYCTPDYLERLTASVGPMLRASG
jgi:hypothetical protein